MTATTTNTALNRRARLGLLAAAGLGLAALLLLLASPPASASVATQQRRQKQQQQQQHAPADAKVVDGEIVPEIDPQDENEVHMCPFKKSAAEDGDAAAAPAVRLDETKLGARLLVAGREKGADAWKKVTGVVGEWAKKAAPPASDPECDWSWSQLACAPMADCHFKYQLGDWHLGRACRLRTAEEKAEFSSAVAEGKKEKAVAAARKVAGAVFGGLAKGKETTTKHVGGFLERVKVEVGKRQPPSDEDCAFDVRGSVAERRLVCTPAPACRFRYQLGDLSPNHSCRRRSADEEED